MYILTVQILNWLSTVQMQEIKFRSAQTAQLQVTEVLQTKVPVQLNLKITKMLTDLQELTHKPAVKLH